MLKALLTVTASFKRECGRDTQRSAASFYQQRIDLQSNIIICSSSCRRYELSFRGYRNSSASAQSRTPLEDAVVRAGGKMWSTPDVLDAPLRLEAICGDVVQLTYCSPRSAHPILYGCTLWSWGSSTRSSSARWSRGESARESWSVGHTSDYATVHSPRRGILVGTWGQKLSILTRQIVNACMGMGFLTLPYGFSRAGIIPSAVLLVLMALFSVRQIQLRN